ncbi:putative hydrolase [Plesiocystis pacifica SIR-1]|uniref:Putative hydrolase n=1 Tax=Plesiocystis pacifica SIR-1 TaxID=391625 RepID=A6G618_9BACT|nr:alpha/beta hydrolase [Plesiocystis pacifica]EDM78620.1 putative hydrolase [Plesiocystis pacifica SIR-1]
MTATLPQAEELELPVPWLLGEGRVRARAWGRPGARPILSMHGWLDNAASFDGLAPRLCAAMDLRIVALDLPGHGLSDRKLGHYHFIDWPADALAAADALGWPSFTLMSHSMGAGISTLIAGAVPKRVDQLILLDGLGPLGDEAKLAPKRLARSLRVEARKREVREARAAAGEHSAYPSLDAAIERLLAATKLTPASARTLAERGLVETEHGWEWRADPALRIDSRMRLTEESVLTFLAAIRCPVLLVRANTGWPHDPKMVEARIATLQSRDAPCEVVNLDGNHHVHLDDPESVAAVVLPFLRSWQRTDA